MTAPLATSYYEAEHHDALFLGLLDTDEHAHHHDYAGCLAALAYAEQIVGRFVELTDRANEDGRPTMLVVTADHGRARDFGGHGGYAPESARVWLVATGSAIPARGAVASPSPRGRRLADVAPTLRLAVGISSAQAVPDANAGNALDEAPSSGVRARPATPPARRNGHARYGGVEADHRRRLLVGLALELARVVGGHVGREDDRDRAQGS